MGNFLDFLSNNYIYDRKFPDKAIDIMDEVCSKTSVSSYRKNSTSDISLKLLEIKDLKNKSIIDNKFDEAFLYKKTEMILEDKKNRMELDNSNKIYKRIKISDVVKIVENISKIPLYENSVSSFYKFRNKLSSVVLGQDAAINTICDMFKKNMSLSNKNRPISFLFMVEKWSTKN